MGAGVETVLNAVDSTLYSGGSSSVAGGPLPIYSLDVPGYWIYSDSAYTNVLSSTANSLAFNRADGVANSGGLVTLTNLSTAISALDEGTIEFFAKSDESQSWRNIVTFNGGQNFKICFDGPRIYWQNFWKYNLAGSYNSATVSKSSGLWLHIALTWSKANNTAYNFLDYTYRNSEFLTNATTTTSRHFYVGGSSTSEKEAIHGKVFGLRVSDRILAPAEMLRASYFPLFDDDVKVSSDGQTSTNASAVAISEGHQLRIRDGVALSADMVTYAGNSVAAGIYTGVGGAAGATQVNWIDGAGTLTVNGGVPESESVWIAENGGSWSTAGNWMGNMLPSLGSNAKVDLSLPSSYTATVAEEVTAPATMSIANSSISTATVDVATGGKMAFEGGSIAVGRGGVLQVSGGSVFATNTTVTVADGGKVRVSGGGLSYTNVTANSFKFLSGSELALSGDGIMTALGAHGVLQFNAGSRFVASGNAQMILAASGSTKKSFYFRGRDMTFADNAYIYAYHSSFGPANAADVTDVTFRDFARIGFYSDAVMYVGGDSCNGMVTVNLDSAAKTDVPYGVIVGAAKKATLNIRNGHWLRGTGNQNSVGYRSSARFGEVNVYHGAFVQYSNAQWAECLYGLSVGDGRGVTSTSTIGGVLNIYPDGVVSNLTSSTKTKGAGVYLRVGSGKLGHGVINQLGGTLYHNSNLQCLIGLFGGSGEWNVSSGGVATVLTDVYVGGAYTNELVGFNGAGHYGVSPWNGGETFANAFDAFAPATGVLSVEDGVFSTPSNLFVAVNGTGTLSVGPTAGARIEAKDVTLSNTVCVVDEVESVSNATLRVRFGAGTVGRVVADGKFTVGAGAKLVLDFTDYADSKVSWYPIVQYTSRDGDFASENVEIVGDAPGGGTLLKDVTHNGVTGYWYFVPHGTMLLFR